MAVEVPKDGRTNADSFRRPIVEAAASTITAMPRLMESEAPATIKLGSLLCLANRAQPNHPLTSVDTEPATDAELWFDTPAEPEPEPELEPEPEPESVDILAARSISRAVTVLPRRKLRRGWRPGLRRQAIEDGSGRHR